MCTCTVCVDGGISFGNNDNGDNLPVQGLTTCRSPIVGVVSFTTSRRIVESAAAHVLTYHQLDTHILITYKIVWPMMIRMSTYLLLTLGMFISTDPR